MTATLPPAGEQIHLSLDVRRQDLLGEIETRRLADGVNGALHVPRLGSTVVRADLAVRPGETTTLAAGHLPDGRPLRLEIGVER